jgi:hypothetical protein
MSQCFIKTSGSESRTPRTSVSHVLTWWNYVLTSVRLRKNIVRRHSIWYVPIRQRLNFSILYSDYTLHDFVLRFVGILATLTKLRKADLRYSLYKARGFHDRHFGPKIMHNFIKCFKTGSPLREIGIYIQSLDDLREIQVSSSCDLYTSGQLKSYTVSVFPDDLQDLVGEVENAQSVDAEQVAVSQDVSHTNS